MTPKGHLRVTFLALKGKRPYVMSYTHRESVWNFREYVDWLGSIKTLNGMWTARGGAMPLVRFNSGGTVRFVSSAHQLDGVDIEDAHIDEFLRTATKGGSDA